MTIIEMNGQLVEGREALCWQCGDEFESFDESVPEGGMDLCQECWDEDD